MPNREKLQEFVAWCGQHISGDEKGEAQIFLDHLFTSFGQPLPLDNLDHNFTAADKCKYLESFAPAA